MMGFGIAAPGRILFGRGEAAKAAAQICAMGSRVLLVCGRNVARADWLVQGLVAAGAQVQTLPCPEEPTLPMLEDAIRQARGLDPQVVVGLGGGAALDMAKALAALVPAPGGAMDHLEVVGRGLPLTVPPLPFVAIPTTSGTGAEATKNAVIGVPDPVGGNGGRKVSLRDDRMLARLAIVDPALTDGCPRAVTLASGLDAVTQVIEPFVSVKATPFTDALARPAIETGLSALKALMQAEDAGARDRLAWVSLCGGLCLANAGLGAVHGLAGVIGGQTGAAHGAICGVLLGPVLAANRARATGDAAARLDLVLGLIDQTLGAPVGDWARAQGLPGLTAMGVAPADHAQIAGASLSASSMKGNPVALSADDLVGIMRAAG